MFSYAIKEINKRKKQYALSILIISLVVVIIVVLNSLNLAYKEASKLPFESVHSSIIVQKNGNVPENTTGAVLSCSLAPITQDYLTQINKIEGVKDVSSGLFLWVFEKDNFERVLGLNWNDSLGKKISSKIISGRIPNNNEILVEKTYAQQNNLTLNQAITILGTDYSISGIVETSGKDILSSDIYIGISESQKMAFNSINLQKTEKFNQNDINIIFIDTDQTKVQEISDKLNLIFNSNVSDNGKTPTGQNIGSFSIYTPKSFETKVSSFFMLSEKLILIISLVTLIGGIFLVMQSTSSIVLRRKKEFGIMKAVGFRNKDVRKEVINEISLQIISGYILGIILSLIIIFLLAQTTISISIPWDLNPYPHFLSSDPNSLNNVVQTYNLPISFNWLYAGISLMIVIGIGFLTTLLILNKLSKLKSMEILRDE